MRNDSGSMSQCDTGNDFDGRIGVRVSAIFVILVTSFVGVWFPVYASLHQGIGVPSWAYFGARYFGSGVIIATAFIHLLSPAIESLTNECLTGLITEYSWAEGICLMTVFAMFWIQLLTARLTGLANRKRNDTECADCAEEFGTAGEPCTYTSAPCDRNSPKANSPQLDTPATAAPGEQQPDSESYTTQLTSIVILDLGIIFHSIFIGLTLAVSGEEFNTLYIVLVFHQTFEGLAVGTRLAGVPWPDNKSWNPYYLGLGYAFSTPLAIAAGLGVRTSFAPNSANTLLVNGVFDAIAAGNLIYTGLVELMAHDFLFNAQMAGAPMRELIAALVLMALGAGLMALVGFWI